MSSLDIRANRNAKKYSLRVQVKRISWAFGKVLFRLIPRPFYAPRRLILLCFGAKLGRQVNIANTAQIYFPWNLEVGNWSSIGEGARIYNLGRVQIGTKSTISQGAHLCAGTHDFEHSETPLLTPPIRIGSQVWICADAFVGPGLDVGDGAVVGACAVVTKDVEPWNIVAGNPACVVRKRELRTNT